MYVKATLNGQAKVVGRLPVTQVMQLDIVLPVRDQAGLDSFLADVYSSTVPNYRHFLTPAEFTEKFGPTQHSYDEVVRYVQSHGLTVVGGSRDGMEVQVKGPVSAIESAFHVTLMTYQHPTENRVFYGPDREPTADLSFALWHISGLDNYSIPHPLYVKKTDYAKAHGISPDAVVKHATTGSGPSASFLGSDMRAAYYGGTALNGAGQNLGLFEFLGTDLADLNTYYTNVETNQHRSDHVAFHRRNQHELCRFETGGRCDDTEQTLDMTQALGMAPGLASLVMYIGSTDTAIISAMTTHSPLPTTIGCSWGWTPADPSTLDPYFQKMAAQGQNFFAASGDSSTWSTSNEAWPADDANVVSVGGTDLTTSSAGGAVEVRNRVGRQRRRHLPGQDRDSVVAVAGRRHQLQQQRFDHTSQRSGRFGERELHVLRLRRPDDLHGQLVRRHQLCGAHVGGLHRAREPAVGGQWLRADRFHQPVPVFLWIEFQLQHGLPRHHQR